MTSSPDLKRQVPTRSSPESGGGVPNNDVDELELALTTPSFPKMALKSTISDVAQRFTDLIRHSVKRVGDIKCPKVVLGLRIRGGVPTISEEASSHQEMVADVNQRFTEVSTLMDADHFKWNFVQIVTVTSFSRVMDERLIGAVVNVSIGKESYGSFSTVGSLVTSDGGVSVNDARDVINCSLGCTPWVMMRSALCRGEDNVDGFDREYLEILGFVLERKTCQSVPADEKSVINCCCENGSLLSNPVGLTHMRIVDMTKETDFTDQRTVNDIICKLRGPGDILFYCSPCTGGSTWQRLKLDLAKRNGWESTIVILIDDWVLHWRLWEIFENVVKHCRVVGGTVMLEWPRFCDYWQEKRVAGLLNDMKFKFTDFDGCMYGHVASYKGNESLPIRKPWRSAYLNSSIASYRNRLCDGSHRHMPCNGSNALYSQGYTPLICKTVWKSIRDRKGKRERVKGVL